MPEKRLNRISFFLMLWILRNIGAFFKVDLNYQDDLLEY